MPLSIPGREHGFFFLCLKDLLLYSKKLQSLFFLKKKLKSQVDEYIKKEINDKYLIQMLKKQKDKDKKKKMN